MGGASRAGWAAGRGVGPITAGTHQWPSRDDKCVPNRHPHGRAPWPAQLERREVAWDLSETEKLCSCCGQLQAGTFGVKSFSENSEPGRRERHLIFRSGQGAAYIF